MFDLFEFLQKMDLHTFYIGGTFLTFVPRDNVFMPTRYYTMKLFQDNTTHTLYNTLQMCNVSTV